MIGFLIQSPGFLLQPFLGISSRSVNHQNCRKIHSTKRLLTTDYCYCSAYPGDFPILLQSLRALLAKVCNWIVQVDPQPIIALVFSTIPV